MDSDTVTEQKEPEAVVNDAQQEVVAQEAPAVEEQVKEQTVPLSALQKERKKRQKSDEKADMYEAYYLKNMQTNSPQETDDSQYDPVTKADLVKREAQVLKDVEAKIRDKDEKLWVRQNPDKAQIINDGLTDFLTKRPNLATAIEAASNRYEEAWELMDKLNPRQKQAIKAPQAVRKDTPGSPGGIPKAAAMNEAVELMSMSDSEFVKWRQSKRRVR